MTATETTTPATSLADRALLVSLNVRAWRARKYDRQASRITTEHYGATDDAGRFNKRLLPPGAQEYEAVTAAMSQARAVHYANTLPWCEDGTRILPAANFIEYTQAMERVQREFESAVARFLTAYPRLRREAEVVLNGMFREEDYPSERQIGGRFGIDVRHWPMPTAADFRVTLADEAVSLMRAAVERQVEHAMRDAMRDAWGRLHAALVHFVERLSAPENKVYESYFDNLAELCDLLPRLNVAGDPEMERLTREVQERVLSYTSQDMRRNPVARLGATIEAANIAKALDGFYQ